MRQGRGDGGAASPWSAADAGSNNTIETGYDDGSRPEKDGPEARSGKRGSGAHPQQVGAAESEDGIPGAAQDANPERGTEGCARRDADETGASKSQRRANGRCPRGAV